MNFHQLRSNGICGSKVTREHLETKLQQVLNTKSTFGANFKEQRIGLGQGFLSIMARIHCDWQGEDKDTLPGQFVIKVPSLASMLEMANHIDWGEQLGDMLEEFTPERMIKSWETIVEWAHGSETTFYTLMKEANLPLRIVKVYLAQDFGPDDDKDPAMLVMEDLSDTASIKHIYDGIPLQSLKLLMENLATVHAYSLTHTAWLDNPKLKVTFHRMQEVWDQQFDKMVSGTLVNLKKAHPEHFDPLIDRMIDIAEKNKNMNIDHFHEELNLPPILTHGDLWLNNMMWKKTEDGKDTTDELVAIIDWQIVHPGCIGEDFVRLLCSSASPTDRREHLLELMMHYHDALKTRLGKEPPFTVDQIMAAYKKLFLFGTLMILPGFGIFVQESLGMLGEGEQEERKNIVLTRARCLIEDVYAIEDGTD